MGDAHQIFIPICLHVATVQTSVRKGVKELGRWLAHVTRGGAVDAPCVRAVVCLLVRARARARARVWARVRFRV